MTPQTIWIGGSYAAAMGLPIDAKVPRYVREPVEKQGGVPRCLESGLNARTLILDALRAHPGSSTMELVEMTQLKHATVRNTLDRMRYGGVVASTLTSVPSEWRGSIRVSRWRIVK